MPEISVVIPVHNGEKTLGAALESVLGQDRDIEVIIVNDGSTDGTDAIIKSYYNKTPSIITYITLPSVMGVAFARNRGVEEAKGKYTAFLDADDEWQKGKLKAQVSLMERTDGPLCYTGRAMYHDGRYLGVNTVPKSVSYEELLKSNVIVTSSVMVRTHILKERMFEKDTLHEDFLMWLRILKEYGSAVGINLPLTYSNISFSGKSGNKLKSAVMTWGVYDQERIPPAKKVLDFSSYAVRGLRKYSSVLSGEKLFKMRQVEILNKDLIDSVDPNLWIFSSSDIYGDNAAHFFEYVTREHPEIDARYLINDPREKERMGSVIGRDRLIDTHTKKGLETVMRAGVHLSSSGLCAYGRNLSRGRKIVNLWHGVPLKKIALKDPETSILNRMFFKEIYSENYTHVVTTSGYMKKTMMESFDVPEEKIIVTGQPRDDCLVSLGSARGNGMRKILYAPTFRKGTKVRLFPFEDFDGKELCRFLEAVNAKIVLRAHGLGNDDFSRYLSDRVVMDEERDGTRTLIDTDVLITDYSSIYIDYLLLDRPIIFLPYDRWEYRDRHGFNFPYASVAPGRCPDSFEEFLIGLDECLSPAGDGFKDHRWAVKRFFHDYEDRFCARLFEVLTQT